ncbi:MAG: hypothetical protein JWO14_6 [Solirubrobacterales bacterium]|nr:hypothetical protein [Solirubrobacterales bacterium]
MAEVDALSYRTVCAHRPPREEAIAIGKVVDQSGYLTALTIAGAEDDPSVIVKDSYEMFGAPQRIVPPAPAGITDHRGPIKGKAELRELFLGLPY